MGKLEELLQAAWEGEVLGEAYFTALADRLPDDAEMWRALARLEHVVGGLVAPVARAHGVEVDTAAVRAAGQALAAAATAEEPEAPIHATIAYLPTAIGQYEGLRDLLTGDEAWLPVDLLAHEQALATWLAGRLDGTADPGTEVEAFLGRQAERSTA